MKTEEAIFEDVQENDGLSLEEFTENQTYIKNPAVGSSVEFVLKKIVQVPAKKVKKPNGQNMDVKLSSVDYFYEFVTTEDKVYTCTYWQVVGKVKAILKKVKKINGLPLKIEHVFDGHGNDVPKGQELYKVYTKLEGSNEWKQLNKETNQWF